MPSSISMLIVTDATGNVVAAAHNKPLAKRGTNVRLSPLAGQTIFRIEVPEPIAQLASGHDFHLALSHLLAKPEPAKMEIRDLEVRRKHAGAHSRNVKKKK